MSLGVVVGVGAGLGAVAFRELIFGVTRLFTGYSEYGSMGRVRAIPHLPGLGVWFVVVAPVVGGLVYGPLIAVFASEAKGHGVPEVMLAVAERGGRIRPRVAAVKALASAVCIGSGGSVGREGPIVQIGSALGSGIGQLASDPRVAAAAAGRVRRGRRYLGHLQRADCRRLFRARADPARLRGGVVRRRRAGSVTADVIGRAAFGSQPFLTLPAFQQHSLWGYALYAGLGLLAALSAPLFVRVSCTALKTSPTGSGTAQSGCDPLPAASSSDCCCSRCPNCTASATRCSSVPSAAATPPGF